MKTKMVTYGTALLLALFIPTGTVSANEFNQATFGPALMQKEMSKVNADAAIKQMQEKMMSNNMIGSTASNGRNFNQSSLPISSPNFAQSPVNNTLTNSSSLTAMMDQVLSNSAGQIQQQMQNDVSNNNSSSILARDEMRGRMMLERAPRNYKNIVQPMMMKTILTQINPQQGPKNYRDTLRPAMMQKMRDMIQPEQMKAMQLGNNNNRGPVFDNSRGPNRGDIPAPVFIQ